MNDTPFISYKGTVGFITNHGCGRIAMENRERYFWQSRACTDGQRAEAFEVVNIPKLAGAIRCAHQQASPS